MRAAGDDVALPWPTYIVPRSADAPSVTTKAFETAADELPSQVGADVATIRAWSATVSELHRWVWPM